MEKIQTLCKKLEKLHNVRMLFAVESGSRAWGMESKDSDFDVRFVFVRHMKEYLKLKKPEDVIQHKERDIDMVGFDIYKFCKLLLASNPAVIEWLISDIVYFGKQPPELVRLARESFNAIALYHHYKSMCRKNYIKYLKSGHEVTYKKYLYAMRGLVNAKVVADRAEIPPIKFPKALELSRGLMPESVYKELKETIRLKKNMKEDRIVGNSVKIDAYIENELRKTDKLKNSGTANFEDKINSFIFKNVVLGS